MDCQHLCLFVGNFGYRCVRPLNPGVVREHSGLGRSIVQVWSSADCDRASKLHVVSRMRIESMREIERSGSAKSARVVAGGNSGRASAANAVSGKDYEVTVRFRDGATTVLNQASPGTWRLGSRVVVVARSTAANN